jgi:hypothetical protein
MHEGLELMYDPFEEPLHWTLMDPSGVCEI